MTGFVMLLHLPEGHAADAAQEAMVNAMSQLPGVLKKDADRSIHPELR